MRLVAEKMLGQRVRATLFRTQQMFVGQRIQMIHALRDHLVGHGLVSATGTEKLKLLANKNENGASALPKGVRDLGQTYLAQIAGLNAPAAALALKMRSAANEVGVAKCFETIPGAPPIAALAIDTFAPDLISPRLGCDVAAWLSLVPERHSANDKAQLGKTSKMGPRDIRMLLV